MPDTHTHINQQHKAPSHGLKYTLFILLFIWLLSFPVKGVLYQLSLYCFPLLALSSAPIRNIINTYTKTFVIPFTLLFAAPLLFSETLYYLKEGYSISKDPFSVFWRLILFPLVIACVCRLYQVSLQKLQTLFIAVAVTYGIAAIIALLFNISFDDRNWGARAAGFIANPNTFGFFMACATLTALQRMLTADKAVNLFAGSFLLLLFCCVLSGSRSAWLGLALAMATMIALQWRQIAIVLSRNRYALLATTMFFSTLIIVIMLDSNLAFYAKSRLMSFARGDIRLEIWSHYLTQINDHLIIGKPILDHNKFMAEATHYGPHNTYLDILLRSGLLGLIAFISGMVYLVSTLLSLHQPDKGLALSLLALTCTFCFFNAPLYGSEISQSMLACIIAYSLLMGGHTTSYHPLAKHDPLAKQSSDPKQQKQRALYS